MSTSEARLQAGRTRLTDYSVVDHDGAVGELGAAVHAAGEGEVVHHRHHGLAVAVDEVAQD